jgi:hypothetical protein
MQFLEAWINTGSVTWVFAVAIVVALLLDHLRPWRW